MVVAGRRECVQYTTTQKQSQISLSLSLTLSFSQLCCVVIKKKKCVYVYIIINYKNVFFIYFTVVFNGWVNFAFLGGLQAEEAERV